MNKVSLVLLFLMFFGIYSYCIFMYGRTTAFEDIISEKCWLSKDGARDIECTSYIAK